MPRNIFCLSVSSASKYLAYGDLQNRWDQRTAIHKCCRLSERFDLLGLFLLPYRYDVNNGKEEDVNSTG